MEDVLETRGVKEENPNSVNNVSQQIDDSLINYKAEKWVKTFVTVIFFVWVIAVIISGIAFIMNTSRHEGPIRIFVFFIGAPLLIVLGYVVKCFYDMLVNISITLREINNKLK